MLVESNLLAIDSDWQVADRSCHFIAHHLTDLPASVKTVDMRSRDFGSFPEAVRISHAETGLRRIL